METRVTARQQGAENAHHRFEVCIDPDAGDGHCIFRGYSSKRAALDYACEYTGGTFRFSEEDRKPGRERGRDMGKPTILYRVYPDGHRVPWHKITRKGRGEVTIKNTAEFKQEQKEQAQRNIDAQEAARQAAAGQYEARDHEVIRQAEAMGTAFGAQVRELLEAMRETQPGGGKVTELVNLLNDADDDKLDQLIAALKGNKADADKPEAAS